MSVSSIKFNKTSSNVDANDILAAGKTSTTVAKNIALVAKATKSVPFLSLIAAPFAISLNVISAKQWIHLSSLSKRLKDKTYCVSQAISQVTALVAEVIKPFLVISGLASRRLDKSYLLFTQKIMPPVLLVIEMLQFVCAGWSLARTSLEYQNFKKNGVHLPHSRNELATHLFKETYMPYHMNLEGCDKLEVQSKLKKGIRVSMINKSLQVVASAIAISAAALLILNPVGLTVTSIALITSSTIISLTPYVINKILAEKKVVAM